MASSEHPFPNEIPSRHPLPSGFKLTPDARSTTLPVTPVIPPTVANGDVITSLHENLTVAALADLWTNEQWLAAQSLTDPTSAKGDLLARDASALARLAVGTAGQVLTVDAAAPLGVKWAAPAGAVSSVFTRTGAVVAVAGDYTAAQVTNAVSTLGSYADPVWISSLAYAKITGAPAAGVPASRQVIAGSGLTGGGALTADVTLSALGMIASGASHRAGIVPDPPAASGTTKYLREDATWAVPPGGGSQTPWTSNINAAGFNLYSLGALGIGTSAVAAVAAINILTAATTAPGFLHTDTSPLGTPGMIFVNDMPGHGGGMLLGGSGASAVALRDVLAIYTRDSSNVPIIFAPNEIERMRITAAGNVGIGTASPGANLQTVGSALFGANGTFPQPNQTYIDGASGSRFMQFNSGGTLVTSINSNSVSYFNGGNVGIGTASPGSKLSVVGLPTSSAGLSAGDIWIDTAAGRVLKIV